MTKTKKLSAYPDREQNLKGTSFTSKKLKRTWKERTRLFLWYVIAFGIAFNALSTTLLTRDIELPNFEVISPVEAQIEPNLTIQEYVFTEVEQALGFDEAIKAVSMIGGCENPEWKPDICIIEPNNSISCGIWMINTVHNRKDSSNYISNADKLDYKKATEWAIQKRIKDGSWEAWSCN